MVFHPQKVGFLPAKGWLFLRNPLSTKHSVFHLISEILSEIYLRCVSAPTQGGGKERDFGKIEPQQSRKKKSAGGKTLNKPTFRARGAEQTSLKFEKKLSMSYGLPKKQAPSLPSTLSFRLPLACVHPSAAGRRTGSSSPVRPPRPKENSSTIKMGYPQKSVLNPLPFQG